MPECVIFVMGTADGGSGCERGEAISAERSTLPWRDIIDYIAEHDDDD